jgi:hypothetical protein
MALGAFDERSSTVVALKGNTPALASFRAALFGFSWDFFDTAARK